MDIKVSADWNGSVNATHPWAITFNPPYPDKRGCFEQVKTKGDMFARLAYHRLIGTNLDQVCRWNNKENKWEYYDMNNLEELKD